jgi:hypothetical protein
LLSEKEEMLIMWLHDGECAWWHKLRAKRLVSSSIEAQCFLDELKRQSQSVQKVLGAHDVNELCSVDELAAERLWKRVLRGIDADERAKVWGSERDMSPYKLPKQFLSEGLSTWFGSSRPVFTYGFGGGIAFATLLLVTVGLLDGNVFSNSEGRLDGSGQVSTSDQVHKVGYRGGQESATAYPSMAATASVGYPGFSRDLVAAASSSERLRVDRFEPVEVEWLRSDGRIRMLSDGRNGTAVVWVTRDRHLPGSQGRGGFEAGFSQADSSRANEAIEILSEHIPGSIAVSNTR